MSPGPARLRRLALGLGALACLAAAGCPGRYHFGPKAYHDAHDLLAAVTRAEAAPDHLTGQASLHVGTPKGSFGAEHFVAARRPGDLHLETLGFFGSPLALLVVHGGRLTLWDVGHHRAWAGPATPASIGMVAPVGLGPDAVVAILLGTPPLDAEGPVTLHLDPRRRAYRLDLGTFAEGQEVLVNPTDLTIREVRWLSQGRETARLTYGRYRRAGRGLFPFDVRYRTARGTSVSVSWEDVTLDGKLDPGLFDVDLPPSVTVTPIGPGAPAPSPGILPKAKRGT